MHRLKNAPFIESKENIPSGQKEETLLENHPKSEKFSKKRLNTSHSCVEAVLDQYIDA